MNVAQYTFQSPSPQQVQVGRLDPNSVKEEEVKKVEPQVEQNKALEVKQVDNPNHLLDMYA